MVQLHSTRVVGGLPFHGVQDTRNLEAVVVRVHGMMMSKHWDHRIERKRRMLVADLPTHEYTHDVDDGSGDGKDEEEDDVVPKSKAVGTHFQVVVKIRTFGTTEAARRKRFLFQFQLQRQL